MSLMRSKTDARRTLVRTAQRQLHVEIAFDRTRPIRRDRSKAELAIERLRRAHGRQRVQPHGAIARCTSEVDRGDGQATAESRASTGWTHVEALHFAEVGRKRAQGDASKRGTRVAGQ